jgi:hypothetical protein
VILRCLAKRPEDRFPRASSLAAAIAEALNLPVPVAVSQPAYPQDATDQPTYFTPMQPAQYEQEPALAGVATELAPATSFEPSSRPPVAVSAMANTPAPIIGNAQSTPASTHQASQGQNPPAAPPAFRGPEVASVSPVLVRPPRRNMARNAVIALIIVALLASGLGAYFAFHPSGASSQVAGYATFTSSGQAGDQNNLGVDDGFQLRLTNIPNPPAGKEYFAALLPDSNRPEDAPVPLGPVSIGNGVATLARPYVNPQHMNLLDHISRFVITQEDSNATPLSFSDQTKWRYYAAIPQTPSSQDCTQSINTLNGLCHVRHVLSNDPELVQAGLQGGLAFWFLNNSSEAWKWTIEVRDHGTAPDVRHKLINVLTTLDGLQCVPQDIQHAFPGGDNQADDNGLQSSAQFPLLPCNQAGTRASYLEHIGRHLSGIIGSTGATAEQITLANRINNDLSNVQTRLQTVRNDALQLAALNDTQLIQMHGLRNKLEIDAITAIGSEVDPSGNTGPGVVQIYSELQLLSRFTVMPFHQA